MGHYCMPIHSKVEKDCSISVEGSRYEVPHTLVTEAIEDAPHGDDVMEALPVVGELVP